MKSKAISTLFILGIILSMPFISCNKLVEIDPPRTDLIAATVFTSDATAKAAVTNLYSNIAAQDFAKGSILSFSFAGALLSDEYINYNATSIGRGELQPLNVNEILPTNFLVNGFWTDAYEQIYSANSIIEGLASSSGVSALLKKQLEGEARFFRAFYYFYLVNLWADVPLVLTTDYIANSTIGRAPVQKVYQQIIADLKMAEEFLPVDYSSYGNERVRVTKWAASALLARTYLYMGDWGNAETAASSVIANTNLYNLETDLVKVFRITSPEAIFQIWSESRPSDNSTFTVASGGPANGALRLSVANSFEPGDRRWTAWGRTRIVQGVTYYYLVKYAGTTPPTDYSTIMRLAEQFLVRAEARAKQDKLLGANSAESDINIIRARAGLAPTTAITQSQLLLAVEQERAHELITEWGHRWLDLKRTGRAAAVLSIIKPDWQDYKLLFPIPEVQINRDPGMANAQNPGY